MKKLTSTQMEDIDNNLTSQLFTVQNVRGDVANFVVEEGDGVRNARDISIRQPICRVAKLSSNGSQSAENLDEGGSESPQTVFRGFLTKVNTLLAEENDESRREIKRLIEIQESFDVSELDPHVVDPLKLRPDFDKVHFVAKKRRHSREIASFDSDSDDIHKMKMVSFAQEFKVQDSVDIPDPVFDYVLPTTEAEVKTVVSDSPPSKNELFLNVQATDSDASSHNLSGIFSRIETEGKRYDFKLSEGKVEELNLGHASFEPVIVRPILKYSTSKEPSSPSFDYVVVDSDEIKDDKKFIDSIIFKHGEISLADEEVQSKTVIVNQISSSESAGSGECSTEAADGEKTKVKSKKFLFQVDIESEYPVVSNVLDESEISVPDDNAIELVVDSESSPRNERISDFQSVEGSESQPTYDIQGYMELKTGILFSSENPDELEAHEKDLEFQVKSLMGRVTAMSEEVCNMPQIDSGSFSASTLSSSSDSYVVIEKSVNLDDDASLSTPVLAKDVETQEKTVMVGSCEDIPSLDSILNISSEVTLISTDDGNLTVHSELELYDDASLSTSVLAKDVETQEKTVIVRSSEDIPSLDSVLNISSEMTLVSTDDGNLTVHSEIGLKCGDGDFDATVVAKETVDDILDESCDPCTADSSTCVKPDCSDNADEPVANVDDNQKLKSKHTVLSRVTSDTSERSVSTNRDSLGPVSDVEQSDGAGGYVLVSHSWIFNPLVDEIQRCSIETMRASSPESLSSSRPVSPYRRYVTNRLSATTVAAYRQSLEPEPIEVAVNLGPNEPESNEILPNEARSLQSNAATLVDEADSGDDSYSKNSSNQGSFKSDTVVHKPIPKERTMLVEKLESAKEEVIFKNDADIVDIEAEIIVERVVIPSANEIAVEVVKVSDSEERVSSAGEFDNKESEEVCSDDQKPRSVEASEVEYVTAEDKIKPKPKLRHWNTIQTPDHAEVSSGDPADEEYFSDDEQFVTFRKKTPEDGGGTDIADRSRRLKSEVVTEDWKDVSRSTSKNGENSSFDEETSQPRRINDEIPTKESSESPKKKQKANQENTVQLRRRDLRPKFKHANTLEPSSRSRRPLVTLTTYNERASVAEMVSLPDPKQESEHYPQRRKSENFRVETVPVFSIDTYFNRCSVIDCRRKSGTYEPFDQVRGPGEKEGQEEDDLKPDEILLRKDDQEKTSAERDKVLSYRRASITPAIPASRKVSIPSGDSDTASESEVKVRKRIIPKLKNRKSLNYFETVHKPEFFRAKELLKDFSEDVESIERAKYERRKFQWNEDAANELPVEEIEKEPEAVEDEPEMEMYERFMHGLRGENTVPI